MIWTKFRGQQVWCLKNRMKRISPYFDFTHIRLFVPFVFFFRGNVIGPSGDKIVSGDERTIRCGYTFFYFSGFSVYIGGMAGFFLGCSLLSFTEFLYYFSWRMLWHIIKPNKRLKWNNCIIITYWSNIYSNCNRTYRITSKSVTSIYFTAWPL